MDSYLQDISRDRYKLIEKTGECGRSGAARIGNHYEALACSLVRDKILASKQAHRPILTGRGVLWLQEVGGNLETVLDDTFVHTIPNFNLKQSADQSGLFNNPNPTAFTPLLLSLPRDRYGADGRRIQMDVDRLPRCGRHEEHAEAAGPG